LHGRNLKYASVAKRMSWSAPRRTSRTEDLAYCLLGIFGVNMPLLYGEGEKAFIRLQEEILKSTSDYSLFAWGRVIPPLYTDTQELDRCAEHLLNLNDETDTSPLHGLFAKSPDQFLTSGSIVTHKAFMDALVWDTPPPAMFNGGVRIKLPTLELWRKCPYWLDAPRLRLTRTGCVVIIGCRIRNDSSDSIGIPLVGWGHRNMGRKAHLVTVKDDPYKGLWRMNLHDRLRDIFVKPETRLELRPGDILFGGFEEQGMAYQCYDYFSLEADYSEAEWHLRPRVKSPIDRIFALCWLTTRVTIREGVIIVFGKVPLPDLPLAVQPLCVGFALVMDYSSVDKSNLFSNCLFVTLEGERILEGRPTVHHGHTILGKQPSLSPLLQIGCQ
jgi:hypothetical protein